MICTRVDRNVHAQSRQSPITTEKTSIIKETSVTELRPKLRQQNDK